MGDISNGTYDGGLGRHEIKHEILRSDNSNIGERVSLVFRDIKTFVKKSKIDKLFVKHVETIEDRLSNKNFIIIKFDLKNIY